MVYEKQATRFRAADIISECLPNSKFVFLIRGGRDVLDSFYDARSKDGFMTKVAGTWSIVKDINNIENWSKLWVHRIEYFLSSYNNLPHDLRYLIKYEDLLKDTPNELEKIYSFLEIDISKDELKNIVEKYSFENIPAGKKGPRKFYRSASPGKWKEHFNEEEKELMDDTMGKTLKKLGYK